MMSGTQPKVRIIHETNPKKYYPSLFQLAQDERIALVGYHRYSVFKEWFRSWLRDRKPIKHRTASSISDLTLRFRLLTIRDEIIVLGFAPWDWRMAIYAVLKRRNTLIYHTSWPYWEARAAPRQYGILTPILRYIWLRVLGHANVHIVAVLNETRVELRDRFGLHAAVIPHAVPEFFFNAAESTRRQAGGPLKLIYVGELSEKKGLRLLIELMSMLDPDQTTLSIIGDGSMRERCIAASRDNPAIHFIGPVRNRPELAKKIAAHDVLVLLSQRETAWEELFGIVIAEAMAAGLGVIATNHIGPRSLLDEANLGNLFADNDLNGVLGLTKLLATDREKLINFRAAHRRLADKFRLSSVADQWADVIDGTRRPGHYDR